MSDGMTDKRSQPDEERPAWNQEASVQRARAFAEQVHGRPAIDPEAAAKVRETLRRRHDFEGRHMALDLAVRSFPDAGDHPDVTKAMLARAESFLAWLEGHSTPVSTPDTKKPEMGTQRAPEADLSAPWLYADVGDVVSVEGCKIPDLDGKYLVTMVDERNRYDARIAVRAHGRDSIWVPNWAVKRIVRKAAGAGNGNPA